MSRGTTPAVSSPTMALRSRSCVSASTGTAPLLSQRLRRDLVRARSFGQQHGEGRDVVVPLDQGWPRTEAPNRVGVEAPDRFSNAVGDFQRRCEQTGGEAIPMADAAYRFEMTPRIPVAVLYWRGDEDFPAEAKILYDRTITVHLAMDVIYALAVGICKRLGRAPEVVS